LRVLLIALFFVRNLNKKIEESGSVLTFIDLKTTSGRRKAGASPEDSFFLDSSASLLYSSQ
jgi:hypothetical protein